MFPRLPVCATFVADTKFVSETEKMFLSFVRNILYPQQMFPRVVISESIKYHFGRTRLILPLSETSTPGINPFVLGKEAKGGCCSVVFDGLRYYYLGKQPANTAHLKERSSQVTTIKKHGTYTSIRNRRNTRKHFRTNIKS